MTASHVDSSALVDLFGGPVALAREFNVTPQAVTQWRRNGIPSSRQMYLKLRFPELAHHLDAQAEGGTCRPEANEVNHAG